MGIKQSIRVNMTMFDFIKGVCMILVIYVHSTPLEYQQGVVTACFLSLLMPIFFMVSGFWLKEKRLRTAIPDSAKQLLIPYGCAVTAILLVSAMHRGLQGAWKEWVEVFLLPLLWGHSGENTRMGALWFILALYWGWCIFYLVAKIRSGVVRTAVVLLIGSIGGVLLPFELPFQLGQGMIASVFVFFGHQIKKTKLLQKTLPPALGILLMAAWIVGVRFGTMDLAFYDLRGGIFSVLCSMCGGYLVIRGSLYLNDLENRLMDFLQTVGRYSMYILCIHSVESAVFPWKYVFYFTGEVSWLRVAVQFFLRSVIIGGIWFALQWIKSKRLEVLVKRK